MASNDDDILTGAVPEPEAEASPSERAHAKSFADLIDKAIAGKTPAAMSADDRALVEVATVIRAASGAVELAPARQRALVEEALRAAVGEAAAPAAGVTPIGKARKRAWVPWAITGVSTVVAAAAVLALWLRPAHHAPAPPVAAQEVPATWRSRPADPLIGPIAKDADGDASARIDYIYADRLEGYRERRLSARGGKP